MSNITQGYASSSALTVTGLHSLAASSGLLAGWSSDPIDNRTDLHLDKVISGTFVTASANRQAGAIEVWAYAMLDDSTWPSIFSAGTPGTRGAATLIGNEQKNEFLRMLWRTQANATNGATFNMPPTSVRSVFRGYMPHQFALFITGAAATSTNAFLAASGSNLWQKGSFETY